MKPYTAYKCIVLDRDGVINEDSDDYIKSVAEWIPVPNAIAAIATIKQHGHLVCVATNQSGIGRGYYTLTELHAMHAKLNTLLAEQGAALDGIYLCPHHPDDGCNCRKPNTGMLEQIAADHGLQPGEMLFLGDSQSDYDCAQRFGCDFVLVLTGKGQRTAAKLPADVAQVKDLPTFAELS
ncbi:D-glycero-beta-D-manno-heptose 1,7-bisphosphate 7-phosphatase [Permianibacter sp. IMCC34836]|uniref:D-glycero-beta-D-manno-heptose 1,7-bisphosphate 7-phosphatase n=1 Tax=Permianibacter fluminis TaxID=2738515 RepID=UPI0015529877|nr:D-glycero-beta-D-manno-heptose 1,7-bisphosphate 7-phosphatase [Permianibacter fluminis]NQD35913.1 D-glycero-beta-D-manno-heptose 1,7-bisphosphate 7-phosphatase [Permianibacter fluminis]